MEYEYTRKNYFKEADEQERKAIFDYAEGYKQFLFTSKTERGACATAVELCRERGYRPYMLGDKIKAGDKLYFVNRQEHLHRKDRHQRRRKVRHKDYGRPRGQSPPRLEAQSSV